MLIENEFHIALYAASILTCMTVLLYTFLQKRTDRLQNRVFVLMILIILCNATTSTIAAVLEPIAPGSRPAFIVLQICQTLYFLLHSALCPLLYFYVLCVTGTIRRRRTVVNILYSIPFLITEVFVILNPFLHLVFYYDYNYEFRRNWAEASIYIAAALYFVLAMISLLFSWNAITTRRKIALLYFFGLTLLGVIVQFLYIEIKSELFCEALAMMGVMLAVESEDDRLDADTDIYNRRALKMDLDNYRKMKEPLYLILVKLINTDRLERATGSSNTDNRVIALADYFKTVVPRYRIYHPNEDCFILTFDQKDGEKAKECAEQIAERFKKSWEWGSAKLLIDAVVFRAHMPDDLPDIEEVFYAADSIIPPSVNKNAADLFYLMRRAEIEKTLRHNWTEGLFEVYYQPTYNMDTLTLHGAEALVRMKPDEKLGYISPEEFIPIAEQIGLVEEIDDFVLREVCTLLESGLPKEKGMDCINVNLSVAQCLKPGFVKHLTDIVESYDIDKRMLNFEITESVDAGDYEMLHEVTSSLKENHFLLSMDDYGTGYSNIGAIFSLDFDIVKIDKSILWNAEKDDQGRIILENTARMIKSLDCKILVEGVETKEQIELLAPLGVSFLQGYYFSRPVPKATFLELIR